MSAPQKVTAYELALQLHGRSIEEVRSEELASIAAENGLLVAYPVGAFDSESVLVKYFGAANAVDSELGREKSIQIHLNSSLPGGPPFWTSLDIIYDEVDDCYRISSDFPGVNFTIVNAHPWDEFAAGIVIDTDILKALRQVDETRAAQKHEAG